MKVSVADYERAVRETEERLDARARRGRSGGQRIDRSARQARRTRSAHRRARAAASGADHRSRSPQPPRPGSGNAARRSGPRCWPSAISSSNGCAANSKPPRKIESRSARASLRHAGGRSSSAVDKFRADIGQLEAQLAAAIEERTKLQREIADHEARRGIDLGGRARRERAAARAHQRRRRRSGAPHRGARRPGLADRLDAGRRGASARSMAAAGVNGTQRRAGATAIDCAAATRARSPTASAPCSRPPRASPRQL